MGGACGTLGDRIGAYRVLVGKPEGKRPLERPRRSWEDNRNRSSRSGMGVVCTGFIWLGILTDGGRL